ncbi:MAG: peptidoglycan-binding domain-containing protein, partial [Bacillota bacterium]
MKNINFFPLLVIILLFVFINEVKAEMDSYYLVLGERILSEGDEGADVAILQQKLKETGIYKGRVDGLYGSMTKNAVKKLQKNYGLDVDGIAGKKTLNILPKNNLVS